MTEPASITLMPDLPITAVADEISAALRRHQVIVVAGETGSGKTTQLPKICLLAGRKRIGHTQPRRIAARSVAERLADELHVELGEMVGYQVRFTRKAGRQTKIKVMTDGVLLAEIGRDPELRRYDTIIIDEAHERSLNIDFLLGYLKQLLPRRPELKLIVTSATIDTARFSEHFSDAPVIEVTGRSYPVEVRYRPVRPDLADPAESDADDEDANAPAASVSPERDQADAIGDAVRELMADTSGDILVFLSGEREIRDTAEALNGLELRFTEILPLYSRLSAAEQHRVFAPHTGRRIVLATNVAETSLTVPGIRSVIDPGTARISRYSARTKVQRLPIEPVSQASANQRAGRCGRVAPGVCIRLYSEGDFVSRPEFTEPEILRTNLASVILQMADAGLGAIAEFPFVEAPDSSQIVDGLRLLDELGALEPAGANASRTQHDSPKLTKVGRQLSKVPLDPRLGRMLVAANDLGCLNEVSIIVAGLAIQDVRERPADHREAADTLHRRFWAPLAETLEGSESTPAEPTPDGSDFMALLRLWDYLKGQRKALSGSAFRRLCKAEYLNFLRIREWQDLHTQLRDISRELSLQPNSTPAPADRIHTAILAGLLSHVGLADTRDEGKQPGGARPVKRGRKPLREYLGARGAKFAISPGSSVARTQPGLVMAGELVETTRLWARTAAAIEADQVEEVGGHLLKRRYSEPHWSARSGSVGAYEAVSLYGVPIIAQRRINYARIDPVAAREIFIRSALVEGGWHTRHHFYARNVEMRAKAEELEERTRRRDIVVDDQAIFDFYAAKIPADVVSVRHFDSWWRKQRQETPELLDLALADLVQESADADAGADFPDAWTFGDDASETTLAPLDVDYVFSPGAGRDGVSVTVPVEALNQLDPAPFSWQVPGLRRELVTELIRRLPKQLRTNFVPAPNHAEAALRWLAEHPARQQESLPEALTRALRGLTGVNVSPDAWQPGSVDPHLSVTFVVKAGEKILGQGKDLGALRADLAPALGASLAKATADLQVRGAKSWVFGEIAERVESVAPGTGAALVGFPALADEGATVALVVLDSPEAAARSHRSGVRRLLMLALPDPTNWVLGHLSNVDKLALSGSGYASVSGLLADARLAAVGSLLADGGERIRTESAFSAQVLAARPELPTRMAAVVSSMAEIFRRKHELDLALLGLASGDPVRVDVSEQVTNLVFEGFARVTEYAWLQRLPSYLRAATLRLGSPASAAQRSASAIIAELEDEYAALCAAQPPGPLPPEVELIGWHLEELRISLFAQTVGTRTPVSAKRVRKMIGQIG